MKKTLYILLSVTICLFVFAKCEANSPDDENTEENIDVAEYEQKIVGFWVAIQDMDKQGKILYKYDTTASSYPWYRYYSIDKKRYLYNENSEPQIYKLGVYTIYSIGNVVCIRYGDSDMNYEIANPITDYLDIRYMDEESEDGGTTRYKRTNEKFTVPE
jgi:hypothetical protein